MITLSSLSLRIIAMIFMVCDHLWATIIAGNNWLNCVGRLAFPIFAFLIAEGYHHTRDYKKYLWRMIPWAAATELPFNLMYVGSWIYPFHQNVLWTFVLSLLCVRELDRVNAKYKPIPTVILSAALVGGYYFTGTLLMVDYSGEGILMVLVFHLFRGKELWKKCMQLLCLYYINWKMIRGLVFPVVFSGAILEIPVQGLAIFALPLIWLYSGRKGKYSKTLQTIFYAFYPMHMLILGLLRMAA